MQKVQLTLTTQEADLISARAAQLGYNLTKYIKFLISKAAADVFEEDRIPEFRMSKSARRVAIKAKKAYKDGKTLEIKSFSELE
jgi:uncharacterized protein (DUF1778 family)